MKIKLFEIEKFKNEKFLDKIKLLSVCLLPIFLTIGTAVSEIVMIILCFLFLYDHFIKKENLFNNKILYFFLFIYFCLILNLIFSKSFENSIFRNIFFIKYIIFSLGLIHFFSKRNYRLFFLLNFWLVYISVFSIDLYIQFLFEKNSIGLESPLKYHRTSGFMGDELKAGALILGVSLICSSHIIQNTKLKYVGIILLLFFLSAIFISGDRSNFIKSFIIFSFLIFFIEKKYLKKMLPLLLIFSVFIFLIISNFHTFKDRYINKIFLNLSNNQFNITKSINETEYGKIYYTGIKLFEQNKIFGVGNKNFRLLCNKEFKKSFLDKSNIDQERFRCNTHPHQIYIEILSEQGLLGFFSMVLILIIFIYKNIFLIFRKKNILLGCLFLSILINFIPVLPGGSFFTSFNATIFWTNFSLFFSYRNKIH